MAKVADNWALAQRSFQEGQPAKAAEYCQLALKKAPRNPDILQFLASLRYLEGRLDDALAFARRAVAFGPRSAAIRNNMGAILVALRRMEDALASCDKALELQPNFPEALNNRGNALRGLGRHDEALLCFDRALELRPNFAEALGNRAHSLIALDRCPEALLCCDKALTLQPGSAELHNIRGSAMSALGELEEALRCYELALACNPRHAKALNNRGHALAVLGRIDEAMDSFAKALALAPDFHDAHSNLIFWMDYGPALGFAEHHAERKRWFEAHAKVHASALRPHANARDPERRLVVGYVSADFREHSAAACFGPVLRHHDRTRFEVVCYAQNLAEDATTQALRACADRWRQVSALSDDALAEQVRADGIDVLIDLSGHSAGNRLLTFARKPAPIQITAWGNATGTGLATIDYLFSDPIAIPADARGLFAEAVYDLPCIITFEAPDDAPAVAEREAPGAGAVTFGSFNRIAKASARTLAAWNRILRAAPRSRLLLKDTALDGEAVRARVVEALARDGVDPARIELRGGTSRTEHLAAYADVDIALDPFPQNGGITTYEALWMGVPVVALAGSSVASRVAAAILGAVGLADWTADSEDAYVARAVERAVDGGALAALRRTLRERVARSAAGNHALYTRAVEDAYRTMWRAFCAR